MASDAPNVVVLGNDPQPIHDIIVIKDFSDAREHAGIAAEDMPDSSSNVVLRYWTDASRRGTAEEGPVGAAFCYRSLFTKGWIDFASKCDNLTTSAVGELQAIAMAIEHAAIAYPKLKESIRSQLRIELFADSKYAFEKIHGDRVCESHDEATICKDILELLRFLPAEPGRVHMFWVPAHDGNPGNERADEKAGKASRQASNIPNFPLARGIIFRPCNLFEVDKDGNEIPIPNPDPELGLAPLVWTRAQTT